jgi:hypothetical protein
MERHYSNEPDVLPHWECHGPCRQGRDACPTPEACERPEQDGVDLLGLATVLVALALVAVIALGVLL